MSTSLCNVLFWSDDGGSSSYCHCTTVTVVAVGIRITSAVFQLAAIIRTSSLVLLKSKEEFHVNLCIERAAGTVAPDFSTACAAKASSGQSRTSDRGKVLCLSVSIRLVGRSVCVCVCALLPAGYRQNLEIELLCNVAINPHIDSEDHYIISNYTACYLVACTAALSFF